MTKTPAQLRFTYEDYKSLPESETKRYELLGGELLLTPSPTWKHQEISGRLEFRLRAFVEEHQLGKVADAPLDVLLGEDVVQPDLLFISHDRADIIHDEAVRGAPDLIVEVFSPSTSERDRGYKRKIYARHKVKEYWLVDPDTNTIEVLTLGTEGYQQAGRYESGQTLNSPLLPELSILLDEVFAA